jgi:hypothetical protein
MRTTTRLAQLAAVCGTALLICTVPAPAQECPEYVTNLDLGCYVSDVALKAGQAIINCGNDLLVLDVSNPALPNLVGTYDGAWGPHGPVAVSGNYAFSTRHHFFGWPGSVTHYRSLTVYSIANPTNPRYIGRELIGTVDDPNKGVADIVTVDGHVFAALNDTVTVFDVSLAHQPIEVGAFSHAGEGDVIDLAVAGDYAYVTYDDALITFDITNPSQAFQVGAALPTPGTGSGFWGLSVDLLGYAYVAFNHYHQPTQMYTARLEVYSVGGPSDPVWMSESATFWDDFFTDVSASGGYAYAKSDYGRLVAFNVSHPTNPHDVGASNTYGEGTELAAGWGYVYVADGDAGLSIYRECGPFYDGFETGDTSAWSAVVP